MVRFDAGEFFWLLRHMVESAVIFLSIHIWSGKRIIPKKIAISGVIGGILIYLVRFLPISFGVHTIILMLCNIFIAVQICCISPIKSIVSSVVVIIALYVSEMTLFSIYEYIFKLDESFVFSKTPVSILSSLLPLLLTFFLILTIRQIADRVRRKEEKDNSEDVRRI